MDQSIVLYRGGTGTGPCTAYINFAYKVTAVDLTNKESCRSERDSISGYYDPCTAEQQDNMNIEPNNLNKEDNLSQNFPNPFNPITSIKYRIKESSFVSIKIYDISGREIMTLISEYKDDGNYFLRFDATNISSGIYYYKIVAGNFVSVRKMLLIK